MAALRFLSVLLLLTVMLAMPWSVARSAPPDGELRRETAQQEAQLANSPFSANPTALRVSVPLGQSRQVSLAIKNNGSVERKPMLYEAWPAPPAGVATRSAVPAALRQVELPQQPTRVDSQITRDLEAAPDGQVEFLVFLADQPDLSAAYGMTDWSERGWFVYRTLKDNAERSQRDVRAWLEQRGRSYRSFWIVNALAVEGTEADVQALAARADVALLRANHITRLEIVGGATEDSRPAATLQSLSPRATLAAPLSCEPDSNGICWNIRKIGADRVWYDFGVSGQGVTVANIDSGVRYDHPALVQQYRGYRGSGSFQHGYNWFDPLGLSAVPSDAGNHGTHTMGTISARGNGSTDQPAVGVAPGARWIAARGCKSDFCSEADLIAAAQWLLTPTDPDGSNPRPDLRPQVINNSWADSKGGNEQFAGYTTAWRAAGIFPVFAAGNNQNLRCSTVLSPGDYAHVVGVGATTQNDLIAYFSSIGPSLNGKLKPDISAPGQNIASTFAGNSLSYGTLQGTSMSAPHVAGAVALIWSANPTLVGDYDATYAILTQSAAPRTDDRFSGTAYTGCSASNVPNNIYGYGLLDAYAAVARARVDVPWLELAPNTLTLGPGAANSVSVTLDAQRVPGPGTYRARVLITDDLRQTPLVVDVELTVISTTQEITVSGSIRDLDTDVPLSGAVTVTDGPRVHVDETGSFEVRLLDRAEPYTFTAQAIGYLSQSKTVTGTTSSLLFSLAPDLPRVRANTDLLSATPGFGETVNLDTVVGNDGTQPLSFTLEIPSEPYGVWRSDEAGDLALNWIDLPLNTASIALTDDGSSDALPLGFEFPFYGKLHSEVYLSANGFLSFDPLPANQSFKNACLPIPETPASAIVPLRADLDPSKGGSVYPARVTQGFLVVFENVPLHDQPDRRFTFQVLLAQDGRIMFNYKQVAILPTNAAAGLQGNNLNTQTIGCGQNIPITSDLTLELRPQPNSSFWLELPQTSGIIAAGKQANISIGLSWVHPAHTPPYRSAVVLRSNDPRQPLIRLPVQLSTTRAPYEIRLPLIGNNNVLQ